MLYVDLPADIEGGGLEIKCPESGALSSVSPSENSVCKFRGDAEHAVRNFTGATNRISVVLEQYRVPIGERSWLKTWELFDQKQYMQIRL